MSSNTVDFPTLDTLDDNNAAGHASAESHTIPRQVLWQNEHRQYHDKWWGVLYFMSYVAFLGCGIAITAYSHDRYDVVRENNETIKYYVSNHYETEAKRCCASLEQKTDFIENYYNLCDELRPEAGDGRQRRHLAETGDSDFRGDEGVFDAFLDAPEIIVGILSSTIVVGIIWILLLRFFAKPVVIVAEIAKIAIFVYMGVIQEITSTRVLCFMIAGFILLYDILTWKRIMYAAEVISYAVVSFKANPAMFVALIFLQLLFAANALLFVFFFSKSFNVAQVSQDTCTFEYPDFVSGASIYMSLAYLWTMCLFNKMRLSVIATIIGSWHFHPEDKPGIMTALFNTTTTSFGTLSASSLISTIAEKICRMSQEPCWKSWLGPAFCVTAPLQLLLCIFGTCIGEVIKMLTKYAVILHVWTGLSFVGSAKKASQILSRHFKGAFVTEITSKSVLKLASYAFSVGIAMLTWVWFDHRYNTNTVPGGDGPYTIFFILVGLFGLWYPVLGLYIIVLIDKYLRHLEHQHIWLPFLAATFVGCLTMIFFVFLSEIFLDTIDTLFLGFAVDKDNDIANDPDLEKLVEASPVYCGEIIDKTDEETPVAIATPVQQLHLINSVCE
mmetsp:Transcript_8024/g.11614  ORF Transcript_8024/g.11614 Transcript_8024/m.11614 type:complete len:613 (+) Transcript_8024:84-1922(+)